MRSIIADPNTMPGDTIDLSELPVRCGSMASRITLSTGEIDIAQATLSLKGPPPGSGTVAISGNGHSRVFFHSGGGKLYIANLSIEEGYAASASSVVAGGCVYSTGSIYLDTTRVTECTVSNTYGGPGGVAVGGGVCAYGSIQVVNSIISGNRALSTGFAGGGGISANNGLLVKYSSISDNEASGPLGGFGGGIWVPGGVNAYHSALLRNQASHGAALMTLGASHIANSTISGNLGEHSAIRIAPPNSVASLEIANSTIAFNPAEAPDGSAIYFGSGQAGDSLALYSSIVAANTAGPANTPADIYVISGSGSISGKDNAVVAANVSPPAGVVTVATDPMLAPLQTSAGGLSFHPLRSGSPLRGKGNNIRSYPFNDPNTHDQRGPGYPRTTMVGGMATVDIGAIQFDTIFVDDFN